MENKEILIKRLLYRSLHRGCKETDILLGKFAKEKVTKLNDEELLLYKNFIEEDDLEIYNWILEKAQAPEKYQKLVANVIEFHGF